MREETRNTKIRLESEIWYRFAKPKVENTNCDVEYIMTEQNFYKALQEYKDKTTND